MIGGRPGESGKRSVASGRFFTGELKVFHPAVVGRIGSIGRRPMNKTSFRVGESHYLRSYVLTCAI